jgi:hypothetical protein
MKKCRSTTFPDRSTAMIFDRNSILTSERYGNADSNPIAGLKSNPKHERGSVITPSLTLRVTCVFAGHWIATSVVNLMPTRLTRSHGFGSSDLQREILTQQFLHRLGNAWICQAHAGLLVVRRKTGGQVVIDSGIPQKFTFVHHPDTFILTGRILEWLAMLATVSMLYNEDISDSGYTTDPKSDPSHKVTSI